MTFDCRLFAAPNDVGAYTVATTSSVLQRPMHCSSVRAKRGIRLAEPVTVTP